MIEDALQSEIFGLKYHWYCINHSVKILEVSLEIDLKSDNCEYSRIFGDFIFLESDFGYLLLESQGQNRENIVLSILSNGWHLVDMNMCIRFTSLGI